MEKLLHFDSPPGDYRAGACVVSCFDARFDAAIRKFLKRRGIVMADHIKIAGSAKCLASPEHEEDRDFVLRQIRLSMRRHGSTSLILLIHSDCGAYGGLAAFERDTMREAACLVRELRRARDYIRENEPGLETEAYFVNFEGIWRAVED
jgi:hypothetical protein